uniref:TM2 domain-containing protein n=1 Tax=Plectus sambesii TaxID=2011161 RepID=A0A914XHJ8_9BILA
MKGNFAPLLIVQVLLCGLCVGDNPPMEDDRKSCSDLLIGQYRCEPPVISNETELPVSCEPDNSIEVVCKAADGVFCSDLDGNQSFTKRVPDGCRYSSGKDYQTALLLSIFLGWLGVDRFYLGYWAIGVFKMCTFGFFFVFHLIDVILIAMQVLGPADGTAYSLTYYGPHIVPLRFSNFTDIGREL